MNTRPFTELSGLVEALCGCTFATQEQTRINYFINRRARRAYAESEFWPRFYVVGEERVVSSTGLLPDEQAGLSDIGTVLRIHGTAPFLTRGAVEYADFYKATSGTQITGYQPSEGTASGRYTVTGAINPDYTGFWHDAGIVNGYPAYTRDGELGASLTAKLTIYRELSEDFYRMGTYPLTFLLDYFYNDSLEGIDQGTWVAGSNGSGTPVVALDPDYIAFVTYKAALSSTYGTADGEESDFPEEWFDYAAHGAYADWLRSEAQQDRAALAEQEADAILMQELEKIGRQSGGSVYTRVVTNQNTQWR